MNKFTIITKDCTINRAKVQGYFKNPFSTVAFCVINDMLYLFEGNIILKDWSYYNEKENGKREFTLDVAKKISSLLNLNLNEVNDIFFNSAIRK